MNSKTRRSGYTAIRAWHVLIALLALAVTTLPIFIRYVYANTSLYDRESAIIFDLAKGDVSFTDDSYSGYNSEGAAVSGAHAESNIYVIEQSGSSATSNVVSVGSSSVAVTKKFEIHLRSLNIDAPKTVSNHAPAVYVNTSASTVYLILDNGTSSTMKAYARIFSKISGQTGTFVSTEASRFGHAAIEKEINTTGTLVVTCEQGYESQKGGATLGHDCSSSGACGALSATAVGDAAYASGNTRTAAAAAIGSRAEVSEDAHDRTSLKNAPTMGTLHNLTIAGGRITATGAVGNYNKPDSNGGKRVYLGGSPGIGVGAGMQQYSIGYAMDNLSITGGYINAIAGDGSSANIGGGYHAGDVTVNVYGGTIIATEVLTSDTAKFTDTNDMKRGPGIGGGGGGATSNATAGATVNIYGGNITAKSSYGAAIGSGGGGTSGQAQAATINISGGTITATTVAGSNGNGAGAAIGAGGSLGDGKGGAATITISGGTIIASSEGGADIGGGGTNSTGSTGSGGTATVTITGGNITSSGGGIGGGRANSGVGGNATVNISGGTISATSIGGGVSKKNNGGTATVTVEGEANITLSESIGGGNSLDVGKGGNASVTVKSGYLSCNGIGGGSADDKDGGSATVTVNGGVLIARSIGGGDSTNANIGHATAVITGGEIVGQFIMAAGADKACTFDMTGGRLYGVDTTSGDYAQDYGAAVYMNDQNGVANMSGGVIEDCTAAMGGAIYMTAGTFNMSGTAIIRNCNATADGGAIYTGGGSFTVSDEALIENCEASRNGGAVYMGGGTLTMKNGTLTGHTAECGGAAYLGGGYLFINDGVLTDNTATHGAGAYLSNGTMTVSGGRLYENDASKNGGAIYMGGGTLEVSGGILDNNTAINGAGAYLTDGTMTVSAGSISDNTAAINGGAIYMGGGTLKVSGGDLDDNVAINGAGAYLAGGDMTVSGGRLENNSSYENGGAAYLGGGSLLVSGGILDNNTAINGAGAYLEAGTMTVSDGSISSNEASASGGGAYLIGGTMIVSGGTLENNVAADNGGAVYMGGGSFTVSGGTVSGNTADNGGAAMIANGDVIMTGGTVSSNTAAENGGAFSISNGNYTMTGGTISENTATAGYGGAIYVSSTKDNTDINIRSGYIIGNNAGESGGALGVHGQKGIHFTISIGSKTSHAGLTNEHICADDNSRTELCPIIEENSSRVSGGGIYLSGSYDATMNMYCLVEKDNNVGGAASASGFMKVEGGTLNISTTGEDGDENCGNVVINSTVHVTGGAVTISGSGSNPMFNDSVTVDVDTESGSTFEDERKGGDARTIQYFENFEQDGQKSGQYVLVDYQSSKEHVVRASMYSNTGYDVDGWVLMEYRDGNLVSTGLMYKAGDKITREGDLIFYAKWMVVGYAVVFTPGVDNYKGSMDAQGFTYTDEKALTKNAFINVGYTFVHWYDESDPSIIYEDGEVVKRLSDTDGDRIILVAVWEICYHLDMSIYKLEKSGNTISRQCPCLGYKESATLTGITTSYSGEAFARDPVYSRESLNGLNPTDVWDFTVHYSGRSFGGVDLDGSTAPVNAGNYTASISFERGVERIEVTVSIVIRKADQPAPMTPRYNKTVSDDGKSNIIEILEPDNPTGRPLEFMFSWYEGAVLKESGWMAWNSENPPTKTLDILFSNYYVDVRYAPDDNHNASITVRGNSVIIHTGNITLNISSDNGMTRSESAKAGEGVMVFLTAQPGYYIREVRIQDEERDAVGNLIGGIDYIKFEYDVTRSSTDPNVWEVWVHAITNADQSKPINLMLHFVGVENIIEVNSSTENGKNYSEIDEGNSASISADSSFTVSFGIRYFKHYTDPRITFNRALPEGTVIMMIDRADDSYWSYRVDTGGVTVIYLESFKRIGTVGGSTDAYNPEVRFTSGESYTFSLQLIVDFSECSSMPEAGYIEAVFLADPDNPAGLDTMPAVPTTGSAIGRVNLTEPPSFAISKNPVGSSDSMTQTVDYSFAYGANSSSRWESVNGILLVTPMRADGTDSADILAPYPDIRLEVKIGDTTSTYSMTDGRFIIPIGSGTSGTAYLKLVSQMLPNEDITFDFTVSMAASTTAITTTPGYTNFNVEPITVTYTVSRVANPKVHAQLTGDAPEYRDDAISPVGFTLAVSDMTDNYSVRVVLYAKNEKNEFISTTQTMEIKLVNGAFTGEMSLDSLKDRMSNNIGSLSLMLRVEIVDQNGRVTDYQLLYFILADSRE